MNVKESKFYFEHSPATMGRFIELFIYQRHQNQFWVASPLEMVMTDEMSMPEATAVITLEQARDVMDQLWRIGIRPSADLYGSHEVVGAMKAHLDDMRRLVFSGKDNQT